jgi:hypothetical protein
MILRWAHLTLALGRYTHTRWAGIIHWLPLAHPADRLLRSEHALKERRPLRFRVLTTSIRLSRSSRPARANSRLPPAQKSNRHLPLRVHGIRKLIKISHYHRLIADFTTLLRNVHKLQVNRSRLIRLEYETFPWRRERTDRRRLFMGALRQTIPLNLV